jgi:mono/diheme cytochrome c family protein
VPPGATRDEVALGGRIFQGEVASAPCGGCHGTDGTGSPLGPDLTSGTWLWGDGSLAAIEKTIADGVPHPKKYGSPMPPMGGAALSSSQLTAVAAYVWALGHGSGK